jgi:hypothetical protein
MFEALKKAATAAKLWAPDETGSEGSTPPADLSRSAQAPSPPPQPTIVSAQSDSRPVYLGGANPDTVATIKDAVLKASPVLAVFTANCALMKKAFPNDEVSCMRAALAMSAGIDKTALLAEMQRTVSGALQSAKTNAAADHKAERGRAVGSIEQQMAGLTSEITTTETEIARLRTLVTAGRTSLAQLQGDMRAAEADLVQRDTVVQASFAEVERMLQLMTQTFAQL